MQHGQPRFEDIATFALPWLRPRTTNSSTFGVCELKTLFRRTDILTPLWVRLRHGQQLAQYQQATRTCRTARDSNFWRIASNALWQKDRRAWAILFPEQAGLPTTRPLTTRQPFLLPFQEPWIDRPFPPRSPPKTQRKRCIPAEVFWAPDHQAPTSASRSESGPDATMLA